MATPPFNHDQANPLNTALVSTYPANERTFRENMNDWANFEHGDASGRHKIPTGNDAARDAITDWEKGSLWISTQGTLPDLQINNGTKATPDWESVTGITTVGDLAIGVAAGMATRLAIGASGTVLTSDGTNPTWSASPVSSIFASGTSFLFQQTAAPTGMTKQTTHNNKALRLQTGTVTTGGADNFTTVFGSGTHRATAAYTLLTADIPAHTHFSFNTDTGITGITAVLYPTQSDGAGYTIQGSSTPANIGLTSSTGGDGGHSHNIDNIDLEFVDVIIANVD